MFILRMWHEVVSLHWKWNEYRALFGNSPNEIELLNAAAPAFFYLTQQAMWQDILLQLCRLTDRPAFGKNQCLSLRQLPGLIPDAVLRDEVDKLVAAAKDKLDSFARAWRNRRFAHTDFALSGSVPVQPLPPATRQLVENALAAIRDAMNHVECHYEKHAPVPYDQVVEPLGGAASLLFYLKKGVEAQRSENDRWTRMRNEPR